MTTRYPFPDLNTLPDDIKARILEVQEKAGFIPNVFLAFARRPAEWRAFFAYHDALMVPESVDRTSGLTKGEREMIVTTTSAANQLPVLRGGARRYFAHLREKAAGGRPGGHQPPQGRHFTSRQRAMLDFAMKVCLHSASGGRC
jgi:alkylhydroperoxidase family enzyme